MDRHSLIGNLAEAMGVNNPIEVKYDESRYDKETGTFYCNGHIITASTIDKAIIYFENMYQRAIQNRNSVEMALIYELAAESIKKIKSNPNAVNHFISEERTYS